MSYYHYMEMLIAGNVCLGADRLLLVCYVVYIRIFLKTETNLIQLCLQQCITGCNVVSVCLCMYMYICMNKPLIYIQSHIPRSISSFLVGLKSRKLPVKFSHCSSDVNRMVATFCACCDVGFDTFTFLPCTRQRPRFRFF